jgi:hypothetical protein
MSTCLRSTIAELTALKVMGVFLKSVMVSPPRKNWRPPKFPRQYCHMCHKKLSRVKK